jgi:hypothetical protein
MCPHPRSRLPLVRDEAIQRKWETALAEYARVRAEHEIASAVQHGDPFEPHSPKLKAEQRAREKRLLELHDQLAHLEADYSRNAALLADATSDGATPPGEQSASQ